MAKQYELIIGGKKLRTAEHLEIRDPGSGELVGKCPVATREEILHHVVALYATWKTPVGTPEPSDGLEPSTPSLPSIPVR